MRGDYLAIVTLGFGEIVRLLALSDWLRPWLGGSQGIQLIAQPDIGSIDFGSAAGSSIIYSWSESVSLRSSPGA